MIGASIFLILVSLLVIKMVSDHQKYKKNNVISDDSDEYMY